MMSALLLFWKSLTVWFTAVSGVLCMSVYVSVSVSVCWLT